LFLGCFGDLNAQEYNNVENVTLNTKLQNHNITSIEQDVNGFLWIGTNFGLYRYDGYQFIPYNVNTTPHLLDNNISSLIIDKHLLWIGSKGGIDILNTQTNTINSFKNQKNAIGLASNFVTKIFKDSNDTIWIGYNTNKISKYLGNNTFQNYTINSASIKCRIKDIKEVSKNNLLLEVVDGNPLAKKIIQVQINNDKSSQKLIFEEASNATVLFKIDTSIYSLKNSKLFRFDNNSQSFKYKFSFNKKIGNFHGVSYTNKMNNVYVGTNLNSFYSFNIDNKNSLTETYLDNENVWINNFFVDKTGLLWIASTNGLFKLKKKHLLFDRSLYKEDGFQTHKMRSIIQDQADGIYAVNQNGLYKYNATKKQFYNLNWVTNISAIPYALLEYDANHFLVGTQGNGIAIYNKKTNSLKPYLETNKLLPPNTHVLKLFKDGANTLWIGTANGLFYLHKATDKIYVVLGNENELEYLKNDVIYDLISYENNELWVGTSTGLYHLKINYSKSPIEIDISKINNIPYEIRSILAVNNTLWLATQSNGIIKYDINSKKITEIKEKNGLTNNTVYSLLPGAKNELWIGTLKGLSRYDTVGQQILNFYDYDGLAGNEFNSSSQLKSKNGMLFLGGQNGISIVDPVNFEIKKTNFKLNITAISWYDSNKDSTYNIALDNSKLEVLKLPNSNAFVNFEFSLSDYFKPENNTFKYRLIGLHTDWRMLNKTNVLSYTNLPPGDYTLEVMAATNYGMWNEQKINLPIEVNQIFYKQWWFILILGVLMLLFLYSMRKYELYHIKKLEKLRFQISRDLHDELGSTLTGIAIRSEIVKEKLDSKEKNDFLTEIAKQSREAVDTLSDVVWAIDSRNNALNNLTDRMQDVLFLLLNPLNITYTFTTVKESYPIFLNQDYRRHVYLIFKEAVTNIIKHSNATHVDVNIVKDKYFLVLTIHDNGTEITKSDVSLNGNGLKNIKSRVEKINGKLRISTKNGYTIELIFDYIY
jgi:ligand-binding sensor domain-containing protein/signal transduction histidine kinase